MTPYPHPAVNLTIFRTRLATDVAIDPSTFSVVCAAPVPTDSGLYPSDRIAEITAYNSMVDIAATGALTGEVDQYLYDRLDLSQLTLKAQTFMPYLKGTGVTMVDLLPEINRRSGLNLQPEDIVAYTLPPDDPLCDLSAVSLEAASTSLLYIGAIPLYIYASPMPLPTALTQLFVAGPTLPLLTP